MVALAALAVSIRSPDVLDNGTMLSVIVGGTVVKPALLLVPALPLAIVSLVLSALDICRVGQRPALLGYRRSICLGRHERDDLRDAGSESCQASHGVLTLLDVLELPYEGAEPRPKLLGEVELRVLVVRLGEILDSRDHHAVPLWVDVLRNLLNLGCDLQALDHPGEQHLADRLHRVSKW